MHQILVIVNEPANGTLIKRLLERELDCVVHVAKSSGEAMDTFRALEAGSADLRIAVIVSDINVKTMSGPETVTRIRDVAAPRIIPALFITGNPGQGVEVMRHHGCEGDPWQAKPFVISNFIEATRQLIAYSETQRLP